jgi:RNA polymerase sigma-70 factor, ECF subfamily
MTALNDGDAAPLKAVLREDAVYISDGGGQRPAATKPLKGAHRIVRLLIGVRHRYGGRAGSSSTVLKTINGSTGFLLYEDGALHGMLTIEVDGEHMAAVYLVNNPAKLRALTH